MSDVFREVEEELQQDRLKRSWQRYGPIAIGTVAIVLAGYAGWTWWQNNQLNQSQARTAQLLSASVLISEEPGQAAEALAALGQTTSPQAVLARLYEAGVQIDLEDRETAIALFNQVATDEDVDPIWQEVATLQSVALQIGSADADALLAMVDPLRAADRSFRYTAEELAASIALDRGDREAARLIFETLSQDAGAPSALRQRSLQMLSALGS